MSEKAKGKRPANLAVKPVGAGVVVATPNQRLTLAPFLGSAPRGPRGSSSHYDIRGRGNAEFETLRNQFMDPPLEPIVPTPKKYKATPVETPARTPADKVPIQQIVTKDEIPENAAVRNPPVRGIGNILTPSKYAWLTAPPAYAPLPTPAPGFTVGTSNAPPPQYVHNAEGFGFAVPQ